jgi:hypothetical protein
MLTAADTFYALNKGKELLPAHKLANDPVRAELDKFVLEGLLKVDAANLAAWLVMVATLRKKLGSEPSFNGGK